MFYKDGKTFADDADATLDDLANVPEFTAEDRRKFYDLTTPLSELQPMLDRVIWARGNDGAGGSRDWHDDNSYDFFSGYEDRYGDVNRPRVVRRLAVLMRNGFLRDQDYREAVEWLRDPDNFANPQYANLLRAYKSYSDDFTFDPRKVRVPSDNGGLSLGGPPAPRTAPESGEGEAGRIAGKAIREIRETAREAEAQIADLLR